MRAQSEVVAWVNRPRTLQLAGWRWARRVVILRRRVREALALASTEQGSKQPQLLATAELVQDGALYEYAVLVTPLEDASAGDHTTVRGSE